MNIAKYIDHTILKTTATPFDIEKHCESALKYGFYSVCVNPNYVTLVKELLKGSDIKTVSVAGFPFGESETIIRAKEAEYAVKCGAEEVDVVIPVSRLVSGDYDYVYRDVKSIVDACGVPLKVILETCHLTDEQVVKGCEICADAGVAFVKTSTGFFGTGATVHHVQLMKKAVNGKCQVKAAGGIRDYNFAKELIDAGATRLGTSAGDKIVEG
ncbi:MAG: deoxyribose-phosphate aldolase [Clostridia bacterium]|nr:deoxyribose-phosphate aldolase [Clostridia bacterium]